jgi:hypothetical protein
MGIDTMGYQLSQKRNSAWQTELYIRDNLDSETASCFKKTEIPMGRAQWLRLREVTKKLEEKDSIAVQSMAGVCKLRFYYIVSSYSNYNYFQLLIEDPF